MPEAPGPLPAEIARLPVTQVELDDLARDPHQPRQSGLEADVGELAQEIAAHGLINPIVVREPFPDETLPPGKKWIVLMGERRTLAFRRLERPRIAARIVPEGELRDRARLVLLQIGENVYNPLNPIDKAAAHARAFRLSEAEDQKSYCAAYGVEATYLNRALKIEESFASGLDESSPEGRLRRRLREACQSGTIKSPEALLILLSLAADHPKRVRRLLRSARPGEPISKRAARDLRQRLLAPPKPPPKAAPADGLVPVPVALLAAVLERFGVSAVPAEPARLLALLELQVQEQAPRAA